MSGESAAERWSPAQRVESVLLSILSLLDDAEVNSPANVDAGVMLRKQPEKYKAMVKKDLEASKQDIPAGYSMPKHEDAFRTVRDDEYNMEWADSDAEDDFGGSESSDAEMDDDEDDDEDMENESEDDEEEEQGDDDDN